MKWKRMKEWTWCGIAVTNRYKPEKVRRMKQKKHSEADQHGRFLVLCLPGKRGQSTTTRAPVSRTQGRKLRRRGPPRVHVSAFTPGGDERKCCASTASASHVHDSGPGLRLHTGETCREAVR